MEGRNAPEGRPRKKVRWNEEGLECKVNRGARIWNEPDQAREGTGSIPGAAPVTSRKSRQRNLFQMGIYRRTESGHIEAGHIGSFRASRVETL